MSNHMNVVYLRGITSGSRTGYRNRANFKVVILPLIGISRDETVAGRVI